MAKKLELGKSDPIEVQLQGKFTEAWKRESDPVGYLWRNGFIFRQEGDSLKGHFAVLVNVRTGQTLVELFQSKPQKRYGYLQEERIPLLTDIADVIGIDDFRILAYNLKIPDAGNLQIYTFTDPRSILDKVKDS